MQFVKSSIEEFVPASVVNDVRLMIANMRGRGAKVRVIRAPVFDLKPVLDMLCQRIAVPFVPTLCGVPVEFGLTNTIEVICVADDDTNLKAKAGGVIVEGAGGSFEDDAVPGLYQGG